MTETKPTNLTPFESRGWDLAEPGSWQRRGIAWGVQRREARRATEAPPSEGVEKAELRAVLPGEHGLECTVYELVAHRTVHLREKVYVTFVVEDGEFRPARVAGCGAEHSPRREPQGYQMPCGLFGGEWAYGEGRPLNVNFVCYSPPDSGAADEAVEAIRGALETLREVATWPEQKRSWFGMRHGAAWGKIAAFGGPAYRPPASVLPHRSGPPKSPREVSAVPRELPGGSRLREPPKSPPVAAPPVPSFSEKLNERVDGLLREWGHADVADERAAEQREREAEKNRERLRKKTDRAPATSEWWPPSWSRVSPVGAFDPTARITNPRHRREELQRARAAREAYRPPDATGYTTGLPSSATGYGGW